MKLHPICALPVLVCLILGVKARAEFDSQAPEVRVEEVNSSISKLPLNWRSALIATERSIFDDPADSLNMDR